MSAPDTSQIDDRPPVQRVINPRGHLGLERSLVTVASSVLAVLVAFAISGVILAITGKDPWAAYSTMWDVATSSVKQYETLRRATPYIISAVAVAIGFKMNLFNIGVEGQFLMGMFWTAVIGAKVTFLPALLMVPFCLVVGIAAGALWSSIAGWLKVKRNVNEVISTIMLNALALSILDWLFNEFFRDDTGSGTLDVRTKEMPASSHVPSILDGKLNLFFFFALLVALFYWVLVFKTRFGFRLRASGLNANAASTAGISSGRMVLIAMAISGGVAGLVGLPYLLGEAHAYGTTRPSGYGFNGIAVALLGRNHPIGIVIAAILYGFLDAVSGPLQIEGIPSSIVRVIQGITLLSVVIINEAVTRWYNRRTTERAARALELAEVAA